MSLDVFLSESGKPAEAVTSFASERHYWVMHPLIEELRAITGEYIDLYGKARFTGPHLVKLKALVEAARDLSAPKPESYAVLLDRLDGAIDRAMREGLAVEFLGD